MFEQIFDKVRSYEENIKMIGVWDIDGLVIEKKEYSNQIDIDYELIGAEFADIIKRTLKISIQKKDEVLINLTGENCELMVISLNKEYFLIIITGKEALKSKINFLITFFKRDILVLL